MEEYFYEPIAITDEKYPKDVHFQNIDYDNRIPLDSPSRVKISCDSIIFFDTGKSNSVINWRIGTTIPLSKKQPDAVYDELIQSFHDNAIDFKIERGMHTNKLKLQLPCGWMYVKNKKSHDIIVDKNGKVRYMYNKREKLLIPNFAVSYLITIQHNDAKDEIDRDNWSPRYVRLRIFVYNKLRIFKDSNDNMGTDILFKLTYHARAEYIKNINKFNHTLIEKMVDFVEKELPGSTINYSKYWG